MSEANPPEASPSGRIRGRVLWGAIAVAVVLGVGSLAYVVLVPTSSSPGSGPTGPIGSSTIELLPSHGTRSACIVGTPGVPRPELPLANGTFQGNTYSVPNGTMGHVGMCYSSDPGSLFAYANWSRVGSTGGWFSYPTVAYGVNDWAYSVGGTPTYTHQGPAFELPQTVGAVARESIWNTVTYQFRAPNASDTDGYDFSFDNFLTDGLPSEYEEGPFVEVMVWLDHHVTYPATFAPWSAPTLVNGTVLPQPWSVGYWCHGTDNTSNANISFDFSYEGQGSTGLASGTLGVNLSLILSDVEQRVRSASCWTGPTGELSQFYLAQTNLGSEDGALGGTSFNYNWTVSAYCFQTNVTDASGRTVGCGTAPAVTTSSGRPESYGSYLGFSGALPRWISETTSA